MRTSPKAGILILSLALSACAGTSEGPLESDHTIQFAQRKARHSAAFRSPSKNAADNLAKGNLQVLAFPDGFPNQGGLPIRVDGQILGGIGVSGAPSEVDEAIAQVAIEALSK